MSTATPLQQPTSADTEFLSQHFFVVQRLLKMQTVTLVKVVSIYPPSGSLVGKVDVLPLVNQVDGAGNAIPHVTLYGRPYSRVQGGSNAVICDPVAGDIGVMVFGSRDLSSVIASGNASPPSSGRIFDRADGLYLYSLSKGVPTQSIEFSPSGIDIKTPNAFTVTVGSRVLKIDSSGITLDGIPWDTHKHPGVQTGGGESGGPVA